MAINTNRTPYFDDFNPSKNFHRILFKPGVSVQARELTQSQTILQNQISQFASGIYAQNTPVSGGQVTTNLTPKYIKLNTTYNNSSVDVTLFEGSVISDVTGSILAKVIKSSPATGTTTTAGDPPTLIVSYMTGSQFSDGMTLYEVTGTTNTPFATTIGVSGGYTSVGNSSVASIDNGIFFIINGYNEIIGSDGVVSKYQIGNFVNVNPQTVILDKYDNSPSLRVGLNITENIITYVDDDTLLDPALGSTNYQAPGADRYQIELILETRSLSLGNDDEFIELVRIENGSVFKIVNGTDFSSTIQDFFAKRDYETNGDYVVDGFNLTPKSNTSNSNAYVLSVGNGIAYIRGYRMENPAPLDLDSPRARTTNALSNDPVYMDYGSYFYVSNVSGANASFFNVTAEQAIDLHCVSTANVNTTDANTYNSTLVSSGYVRGLVFDSSTNDALANTFVYKMYTNDLQNNTLSSNAVSATSNSITFPSTFSSVNNAYYGVTLSITSGTDAGDFRTITNYNGVTKTATVNTPWSVTPDTTSNFALNFDLKDVETILTVTKSSYPATIYGKASINAKGKVGGLDSGDTVFQNPTTPELIFPIGNPYVANVTSGSYTTTHEVRNVAFQASGSTLSTQLSYTGTYSGIITHLPGLGTVSQDAVKQNYTIIVTDKGSNTKVNVGDIIPWTTTANTNRSVVISAGGATATFQTTTTDLLPFTGTIIAKVFVQTAVDTNQNVILKYKTLVTANSNTVFTSGTAVNTYTFVDDSINSTGQVYIENAGIVTSGNNQSLYLSDVKSVAKIIDTMSPSTTPTLAMLTDPAYDVSGNFYFNNGQKDNFYDHAFITLKSGAPKVKGNLLVLVNYYKHSGGDGYFNKDSYLNEEYRQIQYYKSVHGYVYSLRDCLDFRPARLNAQSAFTLRYGNNDASKYGIFLPVDLTTYVADYSFYLGRKDKLVVTKDRSIQLIQGSPSLNPVLPPEPDGALVIANLSHNPYTGYLPTEKVAGLPDLSIERVQHKRYTMQDIAGLEARINTVEYYTSLSALEQNATSMQISDAYGLNRFKNGIMVDDFSSFSAADTANPDFNASINRRTRRLSASQNVQNFPLKNLALVNNMSRPSQTLLDSLSYAISTDGYVNYFTLPYTTSNIIEQKLASRTTNINPFTMPLTEGIISLSPNVDNWVDTKYAPSLLIIDPNLQVFQQSNQINVLQFGDWQTVSSTTVLSGSSSSSSTSTSTQENHRGEDWGFGENVGTVTTTTSWTTVDTFTTTLQQQQNNILGPYANIGSTYALNNGYITDISILPWIRKQEIVVLTSGLLFNTPVHNYFDNVNVDNYIRKTNIMELTNVKGTFTLGDAIGYVNGGSFVPTARILGIYRYPSANTSNVRLYLASDGRSTIYSNTSTIYNATFDQNGGWSINNTTANGVITSTQHMAGVLRGANTANGTLVLSALSSPVDNYYTGNTLYIINGTGAGTNAVITGYNGTTKVANVAINTANNANYSIGPFKSDESGNYYSVFFVPENTFHNGQRTFRVDNRVAGNPASATTFGEGTFYSQGLQSNAQQIDFGASPSGAKGTFVQTLDRTVSFETTVVSGGSASSIGAWDPLAQTFIIDPANYPNGAFLKSVRLFFASKPSNDNTPVTLSIVGTLNGYPNGKTLDNSIVTVQASDVKVSQTPQYLDSTTYTEFVFNVPVYIQPGTLYAFIARSPSADYTLWTASSADNALPSSVKNLPTDPTPTSVMKITSAPYVGGLFISQNAQTWTADQAKSLMFTISRCVFDVTQAPTVKMVVPKLLPYRTLIDSSVDYFNDANTVSNTVSTISKTDVLVDAFNLTTTDFIPTSTGITYSYNATLENGTPTSDIVINPGKYGTSMYDHIYLNDNYGERVLQSNSSTSFAMNGLLYSIDNAVSPIISDAGASLYAIQYNINNCELSNNLINIINGGTGYNANTISVTVSAPTGLNGIQAYATANVSNGVIESISFTSGGEGSGYIQTPTITITDPTTRSGNANAVVIVTGETSRLGGPATSKYTTKKVVLNAGFDSGDLNVFLTAYRPVGTDIHVYYKILNRSDNQLFEDGAWQLMTKTNSSDTLYSQSRSDLYEFSFAPGTNGTDQGYVIYTSTNGQTYTTFSQFSLKIVMVTNDNTNVPYISDMRCMALPANVNPTF